MRDILKDEQRRRLLKTGAAIGAGLGAPSLLLPASAWAEGRPPIGTWPAGSSGPTVYAGAAYPLTGTYAAQGADELKGAQLAVEHINNGHPLMKVMSPKTKNGVLGKKLELLYADSGAKPNNAVQIAQRFISENKVVVLT
ncbi:MAG: ABC transporter substrate-binding protein, partial [Burkholderiaceae bacterium]